MNERSGKTDILEDEVIEDLQREGLRIIQKKTGFRFCTDSVLLADFCKIRPGERVADMGTGSGVIPLLIAARTEDIRVYGFELQAGLSDMAARSVHLNGLDRKIQIHCCDVREATKYIGSEQADVVVTNPPYLQPGKGLESPDESKNLARGARNGCAIETWMEACGKLIRNGGRLCVVFPATQLLLLCDAMRLAKVEPKRMRLVLSRPDKEPKLVLLEGRKRGNPGLQILPPLITHDERGEFSAEMKKIYGEKE